jgi:hypothetical protein
MALPPLGTMTEHGDAVAELCQIEDDPTDDTVVLVWTIHRYLRPKEAQRVRVDRTSGAHRPRLEDVHPHPETF